MTPVRGQGICGSCYALGAVGAVEGAYFMKVWEIWPTYCKLEWFSFEYRIGQSHMDAEDPLKQSKFLDTYSWRKARENARKCAMIG